MNSVKTGLGAFLFILPAMVAAQAESTAPVSAPVVIAPPAVIASPPAPPASVQLHHSARALTLVHVFMAEKLLRQLAERNYDRSGYALLLQVPNMRDVDTKYPGFSMAFHKFIKPDALGLTDKIFPQLYDAQAANIEQVMTPSEIDQLIRFYSRPKIRQMTALLFETMQFNSIENGLVSRGGVGPAVTSADLQRDVDATVRALTRRILSSLTAQDKKAVIQLGQSSAGRKMAMLEPLMRDTSVRLLNSVYEKFISDPEMISKIQGFAQQYVLQSEAARAVNEK